jgi:hypothetical protein
MAERAGKKSIKIIPEDAYMLDLLDKDLKYVQRTKKNLKKLVREKITADFSLETI